MDEILTSTLSEAVYGRLNYVDDLVGEPTWSPSAPWPPPRWPG